MNRVVILCVEDEPEVRNAIERDLRPFTGAFRVECAEDVKDAKAVLAQCAREGDRLGLALCDHVLPGEHGVDFLVELQKDPATADTRKVLITGQAGLEDTIRAVNQANLDHYISKPWSAEELQKAVRDQLTEFVVKHVDDVLPYMRVLDGNRLLEAVGQRTSDR